jgi:hypothetical protein
MSASPSPTRSRKIFVRRRLKPENPNQTEPPSGSKKILVLRRIRPGETVPLISDVGHTVTLSSDSQQVEALPETIVLKGKSRRIEPKNAEGKEKNDVETQRELYKRYIKEVEEAKEIEAKQRRQRLSTL